MSEAFTFSKTPKQSLKNLAYESIKSAIVKGDLPPGQRLLETEIASQMGISRGPVREAIRQLDQEGLTYSHPHRGTVVLEMDPEETEKVFVPTRRIIEEYVAEKASFKLDDEDYQNFEELIQQMEWADNEDNLYQLTDLDIKFHSYLVEHCGSPTIYALWNSVIARIHSRLLLQGIIKESLHIVPDEHREYLQYIKTHDIEKIKAHLQSHIY